MSTAKKRAAMPSDRRRIGALLRHAWQMVREQLYSGVCAEGFEDLSPAHIAIFRYEGIEGRRPKDLAEDLQITKQSVNDVLRHLERCGYIELRHDPADRRARQIGLTTRGRKLDAVVRAYARHAEKELERKVGKQEFQRFRDILVQITRK